MLAVVAVATWASPLSAQLGASVWDSAVRLALPMTLALQWLIWSRHLSGGEGLGTLRRESPFAVIALIAMLAGLLELGAGGAVAGSPGLDLGRRDRAGQPRMGRLVRAPARTASQSA